MPEPEEPEQIVLLKRMVDLSADRTRLAEQRTEMSAERSYLNAERTLSVWVRTALSLMIFGIAVDRLGLFLRELRVGPGAGSDDVSTWSGVALVAFGVAMSLVTAARFLVYAREYRRNHRVPHRHGPFLAPTFASIVAVFGVVLIVPMLVFTG
jgi:putative membrane protein